MILSPYYLQIVSIEYISFNYLANKRRIVHVRVTTNESYSSLRRIGLSHVKKSFHDSLNIHSSPCQISMSQETHDSIKCIFHSHKSFLVRIP